MGVPCYCPSPGQHPGGRVPSLVPPWGKQVLLAWLHHLGMVRSLQSTSTARRFLDLVNDGYYNGTALFRSLGP